MVTLIDVGWHEKADAVFQFCSEYSSGVYPIMGREYPTQKGSAIREFQETRSKTGNLMYNVTASLYKDRLAAWLKTEWLPGEIQPTGYPNFPQDRQDDYFRQYEAEHKVEKLDSVTKQRRGWRWVQIGQRPNHAWDCRVYNMAAFDMIVAEVCIELMELEKLSYPDFFNSATPKRNSDGTYYELPDGLAFSWHPQEIPAPPGVYPA
jgi:phage terminase large subunit GpA-like protein